MTIIYELQRARHSRHQLLMEKEATKVYKLWYPRPSLKEVINNKPGISKRISGLLDAGYKVEELSYWFRLKSKYASRAKTNSPKAAPIWLDIQLAYENKCAYCGVRTNDLSKDHIISISAGGSDTMDNIVPACKSCNSSKSSKGLLDWPRFRKLQLHLLGL